MKALNSHVAIALVALALTATIGQQTRAEPASTGAIEVQVEGMRNGKGQVLVALYNRPSGYPTKPDRAFRKAIGKISGGRARVVFGNLAHGTYAAFAVHDEDGNGQVRTNLLGIPTEGVGASNNARGRLGPPSFKAASFELASARKTVRIRLQYL